MLFQSFCLLIAVQPLSSVVVLKKPAQRMRGREVFSPYGERIDIGGC